jgi:hypothetical protein
MTDQLFQLKIFESLNLLIVTFQTLTVQGDYYNYDKTNAQIYIFILVVKCHRPIKGFS